VGFGAYVRARREALGITMTELADHLGVSYPYWSRVERDLERPPKDDLISKTIEFLKLDPDETFIQSNRLPPDMQQELRTVVRLYRKNLG